MITKVVGTKYQLPFEPIKKGEPVFVLPEPSNPMDKNAVAVFSSKGYKIGYLPKEKTTEFHLRFKAGVTTAKVEYVLSRGGATIDIEFYDKIKVKTAINTSIFIKSTF